MAIDFTATLARYGGLRALRQLFSHAHWNAAISDLVAVINSVGRDDGSTEGSIRAALLGLAGTSQRITEYPATIAAGSKLVSLETGTGDVTMPEISPGAWCVVCTQYTGVNATLRPASEGTMINGSSSYPMNTENPPYVRVVLFVAVAFENDTLQWQPDDTSRFLATQVYPTLAALFVGLGETADALSNAIGRIGELEAPVFVDEDNTPIEWTSQKRIRNRYTAALAVFVLSATTDEWQIGEGRTLANFSTAAHGMRVDVLEGHFLNGVEDGTTGTIGAAAATDGEPIYTILIVREDTNRWSWA